MVRRFLLRGFVFMVGGGLLVPQTGWGSGSDTLSAQDALGDGDISVEGSQSSDGGTLSSPGGAVTAARTFVQNMGEKAVKILMESQSSYAARFQAFKKILLADFDVQGIGHYLIGGADGFNKLTAAQQKDYEDILPDYIVKIYLGKFEEYRKEAFSFQVGRAFQRNEKDPDAGISVISTIKVSQGGGSTTLKVEWRVFKTPQGLKILDVYVDDLSMSQAKRDEFRSILSASEDGFEKLITGLRTQVGTKTSS